jgi:hypothetical protein
MTGLPASFLFPWLLSTGHHNATAGTPERKTAEERISHWRVEDNA